MTFHCPNCQNPATSLGRYSFGKEAFERLECGNCRKFYNVTICDADHGGMDHAVFCERGNLCADPMVKSASPPIRKDELEYLARYKATAMIYEDGSDEGPWLENFLSHREMRERLV